MGSKHMTPEVKTLYTGEARRLKAPTIFSSIVEGHRTFEEMAPQYGLSTEQFEKVVQEKVGPKEFDRLKKISQKNELRERMEKNTMKQEKNKPDMNTQQEDKNDIIALDEELRNAVMQITALSTVLDGKQVILSTEKDKMQAAQASVKKAERSLETARARLANAQKALQKAQAELLTSQKEMSNWQSRKDAIESKIHEIRRKQIYLIAPGYHGEMPTLGTFISVTPIDGANLEETKDVELLKQMSAEDLFLFDSMQEAKDAYNFVRLVLKYFMNDQNYKILVDSESIITLLKKQEVYGNF